MGMWCVSVTSVQTLNRQVDLTGLFWRRWHLLMYWQHLFLLWWNRTMLIRWALLLLKTWGSEQLFARWEKNDRLSLRCLDERLSSHSPLLLLPLLILAGVSPACLCFFLTAGFSLEKWKRKQNNRQRFINKYKLDKEIKFNCDSCVVVKFWISYTWGLNWELLCSCLGIFVSHISVLLIIWFIK